MKYRFGVGGLDVREWIGVALPLGLLFRTGFHIFIAAVLDRDPHIDETTDVSLSSPVPSLREDGAHMVARLACAAFAFILAFAFPVTQGGPVITWLVLNWLVLVGDPVIGVGLLARDRVSNPGVSA